MIHVCLWRVRILPAVLLPEPGQVLHGILSQSFHRMPVSPWSRKPEKPDCEIKSTFYLV